MPLGFTYVRDSAEQLATTKPAPWRSLAIALLVCCLATCVGGYLADQRVRQDRRWRSWQQEQKVRLALQSEVLIPQQSPRDTTLGAELSALTRQTGLPYYLDKSCQKAGISPQTTVELDESTVGSYAEQLEDAQVRVLFGVVNNNARGLEIRAQAGKLVVHHNGASGYPQHQQFQRFYPIPPIQPQGALRDDWALVELVKRAIEPYSWDDVGGPAGIHDVPGGILVRSTAEVHAQVERLLRRLAALENPPQDLEPVFLGPVGPTPAEERILTALDQIGDFGYPETPLKQVIADVSKRFDLPVYLAERQLEEAAINLETPVTVNMPQVSLRAFFRASCRDLGLEYVIKTGRVRIGPAEFNCGYGLALYPVGDLLGPNQEQDMRSLRDVIRLSVSPDSWLPLEEDVEILPVARGWFLVRHAYEVHEELHDFLAQLRRTIPTAGAMSVRPRMRENVIRANILQKLQENFSPTDGEQPLKEFIEDVKSALNLSVLIDTKRLEEAAINLDAPIDTHPKIQPLNRQLDATLASVGLVYRIWNESLLVTTRDQSHFAQDIFDVRDLTTPSSGLMSELALQSLIAAAVPSVWEDRPGPGTACWYRGRLVLGNYDHYREDVRDFLGYLRQNRDALPKLGDVTNSKVSMSPKAQATRWDMAYRKFVADPVILKPEVLPELAPRRRRWLGGGGIF